MSSVIDSIERAQLRRVPSFEAGDRVRVHFQVVEGTRRRTQVFEGTVLKRQGSGVRETFTVRKQSFGVGVERTFPVHSPKIEQIEIASRGDVRRAKLYYLRKRVGRSARVRERRFTAAELQEGVMPPAEEPLSDEAAAGLQEESAEVAQAEAEAAREAEEGGDGEGAADSGAPEDEPAADAGDEHAAEPAEGAEQTSDPDAGDEPGSGGSAA